MWEVINLDIKLTDEEWNIILNALLHKTIDINNSKLAQKQYKGLYIKLFETKNGEGTCPLINA